MSKLKIATVVGTRPEIIRLSRLIPKLDEFTNHILINTGQNYDAMLNDVFFRDLELRKPDHYLNVGSNTASVGTVLGEVLAQTEIIFEREKPDAVMILGDTNSSIAAIMAERMHIPVYHMEAGNRSFDKNVPEELNRKLVDHVSTFNLPYTQQAMRNLLSEGVHPRFIQKTGSPIREIFEHYKAKVEKSSILKDLGLDKGHYFLASIHRQENVDKPERLQKVLNCLIEIHKRWELPLLVSTHPRTRAQLAGFSADAQDGISFHKPFGYLDYQKLQQGAKCVVSDSGTIAEESTIQEFSAVSLRDSTERPEALGVGSVILGGTDPNHLIRSMELAMLNERNASLPEGYEIKDFSDRVLSFLFSTVTQHKFWNSLH